MIAAESFAQGLGDELVESFADTDRLNAQRAEEKARENRGLLSKLDSAANDASLVEESEAQVRQQQGSKFASFDQVESLQNRAQIFQSNMSEVLVSNKGPSQQSGYTFTSSVVVNSEEGYYLYGKDEHVRTQTDAARLDWNQTYSLEGTLTSLGRSFSDRDVSVGAVYASRSSIAERFIKGGLDPLIDAAEHTFWRSAVGSMVNPERYQETWSTGMFGAYNILTDASAFREAIMAPFSQRIEQGDYAGAAGYGLTSILAGTLGRTGPQTGSLVPNSTATLSTRERVLANIAESRAARESANFDGFIQREGRLQEALDIWPPNRGRIGPVENITLQPGFVMDRYGLPNGRFLSPQGVPFTERALPSTYESAKPFFMYEVVKPIPNVTQSRALPWFGQRGMGQQLELPRGINYLDPNNGYVKVRHREP